ncbi:winged helix-turn-helix domain-containing protein [Nonomuraea sp. NBC_01738]|uniref:ArsR/SmtB family transcription factor n=1 Tax=Nonomuraea sp. NBC_01738 TaxID=2976003 RepID=UPI002E13D2EF|nr:winged helix-turn-helix domain-containing protein [Nonomuraea sp. NBC_01738]
MALNSAELLEALAAIGHPLRLKIIEALAADRLHVSELARRLGISRPLLYMHLQRLEQAGMITGELELSDGGRAMRFYRLTPFQITLTVDTILDALRADDGPDNQQESP